MSIGLKDIAQATGFSVNTVSRALRKDPRISSSTTEIISRTATELGYIPNAIAASMRSSRSKTIGVVSADSANPFFSEVIRGIEETARHFGYHILLANTEESAKKEADLVRMFLCRQVDGIISMPTYDREPDHIELYRGLTVPYIFTGRYLDGLQDHSILHEDVEGQKAVIEYLLEKGHRNILYLAGPKKVSNTHDRLVGIREAYVAHGLELDDSHIVHAMGHIEDGYAITNHALNRGLEFTAIACFNDMLAMGALKSLHENNLSVPDDVEVFGYDNLYMSQFMQPSLSTVDVPKFRLGSVAMETLVAHIEDGSLPYVQKSVSTRLVFRASTR